MTSITLTIDGGEQVSVERDKDGNISEYFDCPECKGKNKACMGTGGIWGCSNCEASGTCDHSDVRIESLEVNHMGFDGVSQTASDAYICNWCEDVADGNPAEDIAEALADMGDDEGNY